MTLIEATVLLFFVMDPLGNIPLFLSALRRVSAERSRRIILRELLFALLVMIAFLFSGQVLLSALHVSRAALTTSGGVILFVIAMRMIFPRTETAVEEAAHEPFLVPLAVPYTAGPSVLATELLLMSREPLRWHIWLAAVILAWLASAVILYFSANLRRLLGDRVLLAIERLMGMLLVTVAVEMMMGGIVEYFRT